LNLLTKESNEACLLKVAIACNGISQILLLHDHKGNAISQPSGFIGTGLVEGECLHRYFGSDADGFDTVGTVSLLIS
jgi:hypothetical protein